MDQSGKYLTKLKDTRVLIIGGSSGVGFGVAEGLIEYGANIIISSSSVDRVRKAVNRLKDAYPSTGTDIEGYACDLGNPETLEMEVSKLFDRIANARKPLDHVIFTAGDALPISKLEEFTLKDIQQAGMVRFFAPLVVSQHLRRHLNNDPASSYTLTTGGVPEHLMKDWAVVQGYLAGINGLTRGLAVDLAPIRVNAIGLGPVETELWDAAKSQGFYEQIVAGFEAKMTTGRVAKVEDVVESYLYVMKDKNVCGSIINSNGGTLLL